MKAMKFKVKNEEHSKKIQERLFELGYAWFAGRETDYKFTDAPYLFARPDGYYIHYTRYKSYFDASSDILTTLEDLYKTNNEKHKTMKSMQFKVHNPEHSKAIQKRLFELGFSWREHGKNVYYTSSPFLTARVNWRDRGKTIHHCSSVIRELTPATLDDLYNIEKEEPIKIDEFIVEFNSNGIKIGCQHVSKSQIKKILNRLEKGESEISFKNMKFEVKNANHSEAIQKRLFELGYKWSLSGKKIINTNEYPIFTEINGEIGLRDLINISCYKQTTLDQLYDMEESDLLVIDNAPVEFKKDGVKYRNRFVPKETIEKIYERLSGC